MCILVLDEDTISCSLEYRSEDDDNGGHYAGTYKDNLSHGLLFEHHEDENLKSYSWMTFKKGQAHGFEVFIE